MPVTVIAQLESLYGISGHRSVRHDRSGASDGEQRVAATPAEAWHRRPAAGPEIRIVDTSGNPCHRA
jgi:hypothetical protein